MRVDRLATLTSALACLLAVGCQQTEPPQAATPATPTAPSGNSSPKLLSLQGATMGTTYSVKVWRSAPPLDGASLNLEIDAALRAFNQQMSTYLEDSALSKFNRAEADQWVDVKPATVHVVQRALDYHQSTHGAFDVTVGPLVRLWNFGPGRSPVGSRIDPPSDEQLKETLDHVGSKWLEVRADPPALRKKAAGVEVDLSAIAKGYGVDVVAQLLDKQDADGWMVEIGGEVHAKGGKPDGQPWRIGVEAPNLTTRAIQRVLPLRDAALATSGDYRNFQLIGDQKISHLIHPTDGQPLAYRGWSVTIVAPKCLDADAMATAILVMGEETGYDWCVERKVAALFLSRDGDQVRERATPAFSARFDGPR